MFSTLERFIWYALQFELKLVISVMYDISKRGSRHKLIELKHKCDTLSLFKVLLRDYLVGNVLYMNDYALVSRNSFQSTFKKMTIL